jgi:Ni/Co efflux regulator RcnB
MKTKLFTLIAFFAFTVIAMAQEEQDKTQRQPPPVTQDQVEKDAQMAKEERKKHEEGKKAVKEEKIKAEDKKSASGTTKASSAKKTSTRPGKQ